MSSLYLREVLQIILRLRYGELRVLVLFLWPANLCLFTQTEIAELDVPSVVNEYVIRLEITVDVAHFVNRLNCEDLREPTRTI